MTHADFRPLPKMPSLDEYDREVKRRLWARRRHVLALIFLNPLTVMIATICALALILTILGAEPDF